MRGAPQLGLSSFMRRISSRISLVTFGRPRCRDRQRQNRRKPARCQDTTVSGLTTMRVSAHPEYSRRSTVQNNRSVVESGARLLSFEHRELLTQSSCFQGESVAGHEERTNIGEYRDNKRAHRSDVSRAASSDRMNPSSTCDPPSRSGFDDPQVS